MEERSVVHDTVVVRRSYNASAERVYRAWTDRAELERWYVPGDETWTAKMLTHDFRVGGGKRFFPDGVRLDLELVDQRAFDSGLLYARYRTPDPR